MRFEISEWFVSGLAILDQLQPQAISETKTVKFFVEVEIWEKTRSFECVRFLESIEQTY